MISVDCHEAQVEGGERGLLDNAVLTVAGRLGHFAQSEPEEGSTHKKEKRKKRTGSGTVEVLNIGKAASDEPEGTVSWIAGVC